MRVMLVGVTLLLAAIVGLSSPRAAPEAVAQAASDCMDDPLGAAGDWTIVVFADLNLMNSDSEGRIAVGGNATIQSFGVASKLPVNPSRVDLAVGRNLTATNSGVNKGSVTYGGTLSGNLTTPNGTITRAQPPFDFNALLQGLGVRSTSWAALTANGTVGALGQDGGMVLQGTDAVRNVFSVPAATLATAGQIRIRVPFGSTTLINVTGSSYSAARRTRSPTGTGPATCNGATTRRTPSSGGCATRRCGTSPRRRRSTCGRRPRGRAASSRRPR